MPKRSDPNPSYWEQYGPFQHVKHELIRCYLNGWFPKLGTWARRVLYVDTHAGRRTTQCPASERSPNAGNAASR